MTREFMRGGQVKALAAGDSDMAAINALALEPLSPEEVFVFKIAACDNDLDRAFERFDDAALGQLAEKYLGRTVIKDHSRKADNQFARVFEATVEDAEGTAFDGAPRKCLMLKCYTRDCEANAEMIADIRAGIKKEVSVSFRPGSYTCSICGKDNMQGYCKHWPGREYEGETCHFTLSDIADAYELSFVAVPCQPAAGTRKDFLPEDDAPDGPPPGDSGPSGEAPAPTAGGPREDGEAAPAAPDKAKEIALAEAYLTLAKGKR